MNRPSTRHHRRALQALAAVLAVLGGGTGAPALRAADTTGGGGGLALATTDVAGTALVAAVELNAAAGADPAMDELRLDPALEQIEPADPASTPGSASG